MFYFGFTGMIFFFGFWRVILFHLCIESIFKVASIFRHSLIPILDKRLKMPLSGHLNGIVKENRINLM